MKRFPEVFDGKRNLRMPERQTYQYQKETHSHFSLLRMNERTLFNSAASRQYTCSSGLGLSGDRQVASFLAAASNKDTYWPYHWLKLTTTENDKYISTACLGNLTYFYWFRKTLIRIVIKNTKIKLELNGIFVSFIPSLNFLVAFHRNRSRQVKWDKKKNNGVRFAKPKTYRQRQTTKWKQLHNFIYCLPCYSWLSIFYWVSDFIDLNFNVS